MRCYLTAHAPHPPPSFRSSHLAARFIPTVLHRGRGLLCRRAPQLVCPLLSCAVPIGCAAQPHSASPLCVTPCLSRRHRRPGRFQHLAGHDRLLSHRLGAAHRPVHLAAPGHAAAPVCLPCLLLLLVLSAAAIACCAARLTIHRSFVTRSLSPSGWRRSRAGRCSGLPLSTLLKQQRGGLPAAPAAQVQPPLLRPLRPRRSTAGCSAGSAAGATTC